MGGGSGNFSFRAPGRRTAQGWRARWAAGTRRIWSSWEGMPTWWTPHARGRGPSPWRAGGAPSREDLDRVIPDRPVFLANRDLHAAWVNSRALALAGVGAGTPDPADGRIERDAGGEPSGTLQEGAMGLVERVVPRPGLDEQVAGIREAQRYLQALGITGWQ